MRESQLKDFFEGGEPADLRAALADVVGVEDLFTCDTFASDLDDDFEVEPWHLVRLCEAFLAGRLEAADIETAALVLLSGDHFYWDAETETGELVGEIVMDWSGPDEESPLTRETVAAARDALKAARPSSSP